jgi:hypothetical protein
MRNKPIEVNGMICEPYEAGYDWFIFESTYPEYEPPEERFPVTLCPKCNRCYQKDWRTNNVSHYFIDFPVISVKNSKICEFCKKENK